MKNNSNQNEIANENDKNDDNDFNIGIGILTIKLFRISTFLGSSLLGFTAIAYIIGWLYLNSYYEEFNAKWLVSELSATEILVSSGWILIGLIGSVYFTIAIYIENPKIRKYVYKVLKFAIYSLAILSLLAIIFGMLKSNLSNRFYLLMILPFYIVFSTAFLIVILKIKDKNDSTFILFIAYFILFYGFYILPMHQGTAEAKDDLNIKYSSLSKIKLHFDGRQTLRILKSKGDIFYVIDLDTKNKPVKIQIVDIKNIEYITKD